MNKLRSAVMVKAVLFAILAEAVAPVSLQAQTAAGESGNGNGLPEECRLVAEKLASVTADRDNILRQIKMAYQQRNEAIEERKAAYEKLEATIREKEELIKKIDKIEGGRTREASGLDEKREESAQVVREVAAAQADYFLLKQRELRLKKDLDVAERVSQDLIKELRETKKTKWLLEEEMKKLGEELAVLKENNNDLRSENESLKRQNLEFQERVEKTELENHEIPEGIIKVTRERDKLLKENADMHYNLGVLLAKNEDYLRAADEFKRAVELFPNDAPSYFNLGKLYADHLSDEKMAVKYFRKYLRLKPDAEDSNWVKRFIATMRAWSGEEKLV